MVIYTHRPAGEHHELPLAKGKCPPPPPNSALISKNAKELCSRQRGPSQFSISALDCPVFDPLPYLLGSSLNEASIRSHWEESCWALQSQPLYPFSIVYSKYIVPYHGKKISKSSPKSPDHPRTTLKNDSAKTGWGPGTPYSEWIKYSVLKY